LIHRKIRYKDKRGDGDEYTDVEVKKDENGGGEDVCKMKCLNMV